MKWTKIRAKKIPIETLNQLFLPYLSPDPWVGYKQTRKTVLAVYRITGLTQIGTSLTKSTTSRAIAKSIKAIKAKSQSRTSQNVNWFTVESCRCSIKSRMAKVSKFQTVILSFLLWGVLGLSTFPRISITFRIWASLKARSVKLKTRTCPKT